MLRYWAGLGSVADIDVWWNGSDIETLHCSFTGQFVLKLAFLMHLKKLNAVA